MNYRNINNYKVISETDYKKLPYDMKVSYSPVESVVTHSFSDDVLTSLSMMAVGAMLFDDNSSSANSSFDSSYDAGSIEPSSFDDFGGGDFGGGGAGGEW